MPPGTASTPTPTRRSRRPSGTPSRPPLRLRGRVLRASDPAPRGRTSVAGAAAPRGMPPPPGPPPVVPARPVLLSWLRGSWTGGALSARGEVAGAGRGRPADDRQAGEGARCRIVADRGRLATTAGRGNAGGGEGPGTDGGSRPAPGSDQGQPSDVPIVTGARVEVGRSAPDPKEQERSAGRRGSGGGVDSLVSHDSSGGEHIERLSRWWGVAEPGGVEEGQPGLSFRIPSRDLDHGYGGPASGAPDLDGFGVTGSGEEDLGLRRKPDPNEGSRDAALGEGGGAVVRARDPGDRQDRSGVGVSGVGPYRSHDSDGSPEDRGRSRAGGVVDSERYPGRPDPGTEVAPLARLPVDPRRFDRARDERAYRGPRRCAAMGHGGLSGDAGDAPGRVPAKPGTRQSSPLRSGRRDSSSVGGGGRRAPQRRDRSRPR